MKRTWLGLVATCGVAALVISGSIGPVASQQGSPAAEKTVYHHAETRRQKTFDPKRNGPTLGDRTAVTGPVYDAREGGQIVGKLHHDWIYLGRDSFIQTSSTVVFPEGAITFAGELTFASLDSQAGVVLAITGGTGDYERASGTVTMKRHPTTVEVHIQVYGRTATPPPSAPPSLAP